jgi:hypothetical protein
MGLLGTAQCTNVCVWCLCVQGVQNPSGRMTDADRAAEQAFAAYYDTAELYYAYHLSYTTANQPFKTLDDSTLFNAARWLSCAFMSGSLVWTDAFSVALSRVATSCHPENSYSATEPVTSAKADSQPTSPVRQVLASPVTVRTSCS